MPKEDKANKLEYARRISVVQQLIIKGFTNREIARYAADNWNISVSSVKILVSKAAKGFAELLKGDAEAELNIALERRLNLLKKMEKNADNPKFADVALKVLQDISRLKGQYVEKSVTGHQLLDKDGQPTDLVKPVDPLAPIQFNVNVIRRNANDIQRASGEGVLEQEAPNA